MRSFDVWSRVLWGLELPMMSPFAALVGSFVFLLCLSKYVVGGAGLSGAMPSWQCALMSVISWCSSRIFGGSGCRSAEEGVLSPWLVIPSVSARWHL